MPNPAGIIDEPFDLNDGDSNVTKANATAAVWSDLYKYQIPVGIGHVLQAGHTFSITLINTSGTVLANNDQVKIEVRDSSEQDRRTVFGPASYIRCQEFQDRNKLARLNVSAPVSVSRAAVDCGHGQGRRRSRHSIELLRPGD